MRKLLIVKELSEFLISFLLTPELLSHRLRAVPNQLHKLQICLKHSVSSSTRLESPVAVTADFKIQFPQVAERLCASNPDRFQKLVSFAVAEDQFNAKK
ncbi:MAG: hypothetical protein JST85_30630 [Acidobacteria bacterium]|nr:hypothetical protein [Acidobacteriota bacterium]